jgi:hypothetical protein
MSPLNAAICTTTYLERQKCYGPGKKILFKKQLFDLEVEVSRRSLWHATHHLMVMHPHTKYHWPISKDKNCYDPEKKVLFKKQLFDLEVKGQGSTKVITVCDTPPYGPAPTYQISLTYLERQTNYGRDKKILFKKQLFDLEVKGHYSMWHTTLWSCTHIPNKYYLKNNYLTLRSKSHERSLLYATHCLMVIHTNFMARTRKYYLKNNYLTFRSKVKVPQRSLWYVTHHLMVMHPHTK